VAFTVVLGSSRLAHLREAVFMEKTNRQRPASTLVSVANDAFGIQGELPLYLAFPLLRALWKLHKFPTYSLNDYEQGYLKSIVMVVV
jgi:hypothetical protein